MKEHKHNTEYYFAREEDLRISLSGIRGTIPKGLDPENIVPFIRAFAQVSGKRIMIARDTRPSGPFLHQLVVGTLLAAGKEILDIGIAPTPSLKCAVRLFKANAGIIISASHNPINWNGFKFVDEQGFFWGEAKQQNWLSALNSHLEKEKAYREIKALGSYRLVDALSGHIQTVCDFLCKEEGEEKLRLIRKKKYRVLVDAGAGAGAEALPVLLEKLGCQVIPLHCQFIAKMQKFPRMPEPSPQALTKLASLVKKRKAAIGFALDPDADRLAVVSPERGAISEEYTLPLALLGLDPLLKKRQRAGKANHLVFNFSTSSLCSYFTSAYNTKIFRSSVGEANVVDLMQKKKAVFGGEGNGGVIVPDIPSFGRDPLIGAALILSAMATAKADSVDRLLDFLPKLYMHKSKYKLAESSFEDISERFLLEFPAAKANHSDGLHLSLPDKSWLHLRPSNTEAVLRLIAEGATQESLKEILRCANRILKIK